MMKFFFKLFCFFPSEFSSSFSHSGRPLFSSPTKNKNTQVGYFPIVVTRELALALTLYAAATQALLYHVRTPRHLEPLWFANIASQILWW